MRFRIALLAVALLAASAARAEDAAPSALDPKEEASLQGFGAAHPECREWNDGCATCLRDVAAKCSTPGIACLPGAIVCSKSP